MFAPVVSRFITYGVKLGAEAQEYAEAIWELPAMQAWLEDADQELEQLDRFHVYKY
jgi:glutathione S-transferase